MTALLSEKEIELGISPSTRFVDDYRAATNDGRQNLHSKIKKSICGWRFGFTFWRKICHEPGGAEVVSKPRLHLRCSLATWNRTAPLSEKLCLPLLIFASIFLGFATIQVIVLGSTVFRPECAPGSITSTYCKVKAETSVLSYNLEIQKYFYETTAGSESDLADLRSKMDRVQRLLGGYAYNMENCINYDREFGCRLVMVLVSFLHLCVVWKLIQAKRKPDYVVGFKDVAVKWCSWFYSISFYTGSLLVYILSFCPVEE